jgi:hypothetical protein
LAQDPAGAFDQYAGSVPVAEQAELTQQFAPAHQKTRFACAAVLCFADRVLRVSELHELRAAQQQQLELLKKWEQFQRIPQFGVPALVNQGIDCFGQQTFQDDGLP